MLLTNSGATGLSVFRLLVEAEGYEIEQHLDAATTLNAAFLSDYDAVIFGLHQKIWTASEKTALDTWLRAGGSFLTYSDSASGGFHGTVGIKNKVGQNAVNNLTTTYGLQVTVDQGSGTRAYTAGVGATHPIVAGPLILEGEGVSPVAVNPNSCAQILIPFNTANQVSCTNLNIDPQGVTITTPQWASFALQTVGNGHVLVLFDRQPMWNSGPGSDITKRDNTEVLRRTVRFMVGDLTVAPPQDFAPIITADPVSLTRHEGLLGGGLAFNGTNFSVQIPAFNVTGQALTIGLWMRHDGSVSRDARFISKASSTNSTQNYWKIGPHDNRRVRARLRANGTTYELNTADEVFEFATWHHIAMTYNGSTLRVLVDGTEVGSIPASGNLNSVPTVGVTLGDQPTGTGSRAFEGSLDQVRIYNRALDEVEINSLRQEPFFTSVPSFATWMAELPNPPPADLRGQFDDPDNDGLNNLLEYALGGDPMIPGSARRPLLAISESDGETASPLTLHYFKAAPDLIHVVESSSNLAPLSWQIEATEEMFDPVTNLHSRTHTPPADAPRSFLRLKVRQEE